jgi:squalene-associated FAD-dependent desaturase
MITENNRNIVIIGGGVAGLSAAIYALDYGFTPLILEKNRYIGGRVRSFYAKDIEHIIDNGQHILATAYEETRSLLKKIGALEKVDFQTKFETRFLKSPKNDIHFRSASLPSPLHFFLPLLRHRNFTQISLKDFWHLFRYFVSPGAANLNEFTLTQWLEKYKQSREIKELLWHPLSLSILNTPPESASADLLLTAVRKSFLGPRKLAGLGIPKNWLSEIFAHPADQYLQMKGVEVELLSTVQKIVKSENQHFTVHTQKKTYDTSGIISTLPPFALKDILEGSSLPEMNQILEILPQFEYHAIMTINIWLTQELPGYFPASVVGSPIQWIFKHPQTEPGKMQYGYALVFSVADQWIELSREELITMVYRELVSLFGKSFNDESPISVYKIIKEKRATISQTPRMATIRPDSSTPLRDFKLAGDWTNTGLPATIEGAILSGRLAVKNMVKT